MLTLVTVGVFLVLFGYAGVTSTSNDPTDPNGLIHVVAGLQIALALAGITLCTRWYWALPALVASALTGVVWFAVVVVSAG
ncbi:MAG: hypothetical protein WKF40_08605 [Thermoleophilaceae bacterium]